MERSAVKGIAALAMLIGFIVFAFRQGFSVRRPPEGTPPDSTGGYGSTDSSNGHLS